MVCGILVLLVNLTPASVSAPQLTLASCFDSQLCQSRVDMADRGWCRVAILEWTTGDNTLMSEAGGVYYRIYIIYMYNHFSAEYINIQARSHSLALPNLQGSKWIILGPCRIDTGPNDI